MTLLSYRGGYFFELLGFIPFLKDWEWNFQINN